MNGSRYRVLLVFGVALATQACAPHVVGFTPVGAITVRVASDQDADVVWILKNDRDKGEGAQTLLRCHNTAQGPVCLPAKVSL